LGQRTLKITGMTCGGCAEHVRRALNALEGVEATVSYPEATARVEAGPDTPAGALLAAVTEAGYGAELLPDSAGPREGRSGADLHIAVIGGGSAAFAAAVRATEAGARVTLIERGTLGGTCVNVGCVPSKIRLRAAEAAHRAAHHPFSGVGHGRPTVDPGRLVAQQQARVEELRGAKYWNVLTARPEISLLEGSARFEDAGTLVVADNGGGETRLSPDRVLVATGSRPRIPPIPGLGEAPYWTSTEALNAAETPGHLIVLGGGYIGCELAQTFARQGSAVTLITRRGLLSDHDPALGETLAGVFADEGIRVLPNSEVRSVSYGEGFVLELAGGERITGERLLLAAGRDPATEDLGLERAGVSTDGQGAIHTDDRMRTSTPGIYAAGDCTDKPRLVYVGAAAGTRAAVQMTGGDARLDLSVVPRVVFTDPQVATVGLGEAEARYRGYTVESRTLPLDQVPRALANFETRGLVKLVAESGTGRLLGAHLAAEGAGEVIETAALALRHGLTVQDLGDELFPYLTMAEGLKLCAQTFTRDVSELSCCAG